ncbi:hypothetical protein HMPREF0321_1646 [Dermacoccus sp. Ellin185]|nr:hypothetical protein HMPREF0321_1646 [Dermacoccus sp. Ellin185]
MATSPFGLEVGRAEATWQGTRVDKSLGGNRRRTRRGSQSANAGCRDDDRRQAPNQ